MDQSSVKVLDKEVMEEVDEAYQFADQAPDPEPAELFNDVYAPAIPERSEGGMPSGVAPSLRSG